MDVDSAPTGAAAENPPWYYGQGRLCPVRLLCFDIVSVFIFTGSFCCRFCPLFGGISLRLVRSFQSGFLRLPAGSRCITSPGNISHTGRSFDWNNPSMNYLYHRTFLYPVPYIHESGMNPTIQKIPRWLIFHKEVKTQRLCNQPE